MSYATNVHIELPIKKFDEEQKAYFSGAVKNLTNAKMMLFVLTDGDQNRGYSLDRIAPIVGGLKIPIYSIGYNLTPDSTPTKELTRLSNINEAAMIDAKSADLVNQLRNLFNTQL